MRFGRAPRDGQGIGWGGIRTHGRLAPTPVFKTGALNRSATHPKTSRQKLGAKHNAKTCLFARHALRDKGGTKAHQRIHIARLVKANHGIGQLPGALSAQHRIR